MGKVFPPMMHGTGWPMHSAATAMARFNAGSSTSRNWRGERIGGAAADSKNATSSPAFAMARQSTAWFSARRMQHRAGFLRARDGVFAEVGNAAQVEGDGERAGHRDAHVGVRETRASTAAPRG